MRVQFDFYFISSSVASGSRKSLALDLDMMERPNLLSS